MPSFGRIAVSTFVAVLLGGAAVEAQSPFERDRSGGGWDWCDPTIDPNCSTTYRDFNEDAPWAHPWCRTGPCDPPGQVPSCLDRDGRRCRGTPPSIPPLIILPPVIITGPSPRPNVPSSGILGQPIEGVLIELYTGVRLPFDEPPVATAAALGAIALQAIPWVRALAKLRGVGRLANAADFSRNHTSSNGHSPSGKPIGSRQRGHTGA
jgi:hypothetical protein